MYTILKAQLFRRLKSLNKKKAKLASKIEYLDKHRYSRKYRFIADEKIEKFSCEIKIIEAEIEIINDELDYLAKDKPNNVNKLFNNNVNFGKNDSGPKISFSD